MAQRQMTEGRGQMTEGRGQKAGVSRRDGGKRRITRGCGEGLRWRLPRRPAKRSTPRNDVVITLICPNKC